MQSNNIYKYDYNEDLKIQNFLHRPKNMNRRHYTISTPQNWDVIYLLLLEERKHKCELNR